MKMVVKLTTINILKVFINRLILLDPLTEISPEDRRTIQELHERAEVNDSRMRIAKKEADRSHKGVLESEARRFFRTGSDLDVRKGDG